MELEWLQRASSGLRLASVGGIANWRGPQVGAAPGGRTPRSVCNSSTYTSSHIRPKYAEMVLQNCNIKKKKRPHANLPRQGSSCDNS